MIGRWRSTNFVDTVGLGTGSPASAYTTALIRPLSPLTGPWESAPITRTWPFLAPSAHELATRFRLQLGLQPSLACAIWTRFHGTARTQWWLRAGWRCEHSSSTVRPTWKPLVESAELARISLASTCGLKP